MSGNAIETTPSIWPVDGDAHVLTSRALSLLSIGRPYEGVRIVTWAALLVEPQGRGLIISYTSDAYPAMVDSDRSHMYKRHSSVLRRPGASHIDVCF